VAVIVSMTLAIVFSPLPSAPIALASGTVYGHTLGTLYVLIGAEVGALAAFGIARLVGTELHAQTREGVAIGFNQTPITAVSDAFSCSISLPALLTSSGVPWAMTR
jgi:membrane protein DedA with SNARE-associated domain